MAAASLASKERRPNFAMLLVGLGIAIYLALPFLPLVPTATGTHGARVQFPPDATRYVAAELVGVFVRPLIALVGLLFVVKGRRTLGATVILVLGLLRTIDLVGNYMYPAPQDAAAIVEEALNFVISLTLILGAVLLLRDDEVEREIEPHVTSTTQAAALILATAAVLVVIALPLLNIYRWNRFDPTYHLPAFKFGNLRHGTASLLIYESMPALGLVGLIFLRQRRHILSAGVFLAIGLYDLLFGIWSIVLPSFISFNSRTYGALDIGVAGLFCATAALLFIKIEQAQVIPVRPDTLLVGGT
jgi:hypothetical protein